MWLLRERLSDFRERQFAKSPSVNQILHRVDSLVHPKNSKHLRSHWSNLLWSRAILALDHRRLGLENKFLENNQAAFFLRSTGLLYKFLPTNLGVCKPTFYTLYTSHLRWNSTIYHTDLGQKAVFHNFSRQIALSQYSGRPIVGF